MTTPTEENAPSVQASKAKPPVNYELEDCFACRATGTAAFVGLGVYSYTTGMANLRAQEKEIMRSATKYKMGSRRLGIVTISAALVGMGVWRAFN